MITAVLIVPAAPWLIPSVAPVLLAEQTGLRRSIDALIGATSVDSWAALGVGGARSRPRWDPDVPLDLGPDPYRGGSVSDSTTVTDRPGGHWVARALLGPVRLDAGTVGPRATGDDRIVTAALTELAADSLTHAVLVTADGSTAHGEHAPGAPDERAAGYDAALHEALLGGPTATRAWLATEAGSAGIATELGATLPAALSGLLGALPASADWDVSVGDVTVGEVHSGERPGAGVPAPYGVGHHVVRWTRR